MNKTLSDLINEAWLTGSDASFEYNGVTSNFDPAGLVQFIVDNSPSISSKTEIAALTETSTAADIVAALQA